VYLVSMITAEEFSVHYTKSFKRSVTYISHKFRLSVEDAEDACQRGWIKAWNYRASYTGAASFYSWAVAIIINEVLSDLRRKDALRGAEQVEPWHAYDSGHDVVRTLTLERAFALAELLTPTEQLVFKLWCAGLEVRLIGTKVGKTTGATKSYLHRAIAKLTVGCGGTCPVSFLKDARSFITVLASRNNGSVACRSI
jgi:RNA polymerase sigma factor (sigma-70 family)